MNLGIRTMWALLVATSVGRAQGISPEAAGLAPSSVSAPRAAGLTLSGSPDVSISIDVPSGRGVEPHVALAYSAGAHGIAGWSWALDLGTVTRTAARGGPPAYDASDHYVVSVNGAGGRLVQVGGHYETEQQSFAIVEHVREAGRDYFKQANGDGTVFYFGYGTADPSASRTSDGGDQIYRWHLDRVVDRHGNFLTISYRRFDDSENQLYPSVITYTGKVDSATVHPSEISDGAIATDRRRRVIFDYEAYGAGGANAGDRSLIAGFPIVTTHRLAAIRVEHVASQLRRYALAYRTEPNSRRPMLEAVQLFGTDDRTSLPATRFVYQDATAGFGGGIQRAVEPSDEAEHVFGRLDGNRPHATDPLRLHDQGLRYVDLDGDGRTDYLRSFVASCDAPQDVRLAYRGVAGGWQAMPGFAPPTSFAEKHASFAGPSPICANDSDMGVRIADINGDGYPDLVQSLLLDNGHLRGVWLNKLGLPGRCDPAGPVGNCWQLSMNLAVPTAAGPGPKPDTTCSFTGAACCDRDLSCELGEVGYCSDCAQADPLCDIAVCDGNTDCNDPVSQLCCSSCVEEACGDARCSGGETAASCPDDCGTIDPTTTCVFATSQGDASRQSSHYDLGCHLADVTGDGLADLVLGLEVEGRVGLHVWRATGGGWVADDARFAPPRPFVRIVRDADDNHRLASLDLGWRLADVNADGLTDLVRGYSDDTAPNRMRVDAACYRQSAPTGECFAVALNNGFTGGWDLHTAAMGDDVFRAYAPASAGFGGTGPTGFVFTSSNPLRSTSTGWDFADLDGDGSLDLFRALSLDGATCAGCNETFLNDGEGAGWQASPAHRLPIATFRQYRGYMTGTEGVALVDLDGDGQVDLARSTRRSAELGGSQNAVLINRASKPYLLAKVVYPSGGSQEFTYTPSTAFDNDFLPYPMHVVTESRLRAADGAWFGSAAEGTATRPPDIVTRQSYRGGFVAMSAARVEHRGFRQVDQIELDAAGQPALVRRTLIHTAVPWLPATGAEYLKGRTESTQVLHGERLMSRVDTTYHPDLDGEPWFVPEHRIASLQCDGVDPGACIRAETETRAYDVDGNPTHVVTTGFGTPNLIRTQYTTWERRDGVRVLHLQTGARSYAGDSPDDGRDTLQASTRTYTELGDLESSSVVIADGQVATERYEYDAFGHAAVHVDVFGARTTTLYDLPGVDDDCLDFTYPRRVVNALGHQTTSVHSCETGFAVQTAGPNGVPTLVAHDELGRIRTTQLPGDTAATLQFDYLDIGLPGKQRVKRTRLDGTADGLWAEEIFDGLGRKIAARAEGDAATAGSAARIVYSTFGFDHRGRAEYVSAPAFGAPSNLGTTTRYDVLSRPVATRDPGLPESTTAYDLRVTTSVDPMGHRRVQTTDALGRLAEVDDDGVKTSYRYDHRDAIIEIIGPSGDPTPVCDGRTIPAMLPKHHACFAYDRAGRRIATRDFDLGGWTYTYDQGGRVIAQTDARGVTSTTTYDVLGRVLSVRFSDGTEPIAYTYDAYPPADAIAPVVIAVVAPDSSASLRRGSPAVIYGTGFGTANVVAIVQGGRSYFITRGTPAWFESANQLNITLPSELSAGTATLVVANQDAALHSAAVSIEVTP